MIAEAPSEGGSTPYCGLEVELGAGETEDRDGLVDRAVGLGARVVLADPLAAVQQAGRAVVAAAGGDGGVEIERSVGRSGTATATTSGRRRADPSARPAGSP
jgi:hypothetical protein